MFFIYGDSFKNNPFESRNVTNILALIVATGLQVRILYLHSKNIIELVKEENYTIKILVGIVYSIMNIIFLFAYCYTIIYYMDLTSFKNVCSGNSYEVLFDFYYFSTVTFTTLGYGDILPVSILAKIMVMAEVLIFTVFVSIIALGIISNKSKEKGE